MTIVQDIVKKVDQRGMDFSKVWERMDDDYSLWRMDDFQEAEGQGVDFRQYTSNDPRTFGRKAV